ncbi:hypothetical protein D0962_32345 [Leptolyngbyaceae cyanobacterium CCMR0082]|uniref:Tocopherol cyclase n=1 Tax=Adonisia turfae CCMR0082 TaxID=2304604 RepID=A0A6M0SFY5_9CYAN|nr:hypothetical protein [Adonisia turfae]MDV3348436.1 hypothetical protein [Leptothoe sp. LEGE 181152]NEZ67395.1 hypothetical protein [Adonisia turfae CCMR0082]
MSTTPSTDKQLGWHILQPPRQAFGIFSRLRLEWDYFMIHDHGGTFTGSIGYVLADPTAQRVRWLKRFTLLPSGVGVAIAGMFTHGHKIANFLHFDFDQAQLSTDTKSLTAQDDVSNLQATFHVKPNNSLQIAGCTHDIEYQLAVQEDWQNHSSHGSEVFTPITGRDMGLLPWEQWTVDVIWPRTQVSGYIRDLRQKVTFEIVGHGYRENSFGRWLFWAGGWDFAAMSDEKTGVQWVWQTYHHSQDLSYLDLSFPIEGVPQAFRFWAREGQLQWQHHHWCLDPKAQQKFPLDATIYAHNQDYIVETTLSIGDNEIALLHENSWYTRIYVIFALFPFCKGSIYRVADGARVLEFSGQGGGEYSTLRFPKIRLS